MPGCALSNLLNNVFSNADVIVNINVKTFTNKESMKRTFGGMFM